MFRQYQKMCFLPVFTKIQPHGLKDTDVGFFVAIPKISVKLHKVTTNVKPKRSGKNQDSFWWRSSPSSCWMLSMRCSVAGGGSPKDERYQGYPGVLFGNWWPFIPPLEVMKFMKVPKTVQLSGHRQTMGTSKEIRWIRCMMFFIICFCWEQSHKMFIIISRYEISWVTVTTLFQSETFSRFKEPNEIVTTEVQSA